MYSIDDLKNVEVPKGCLSYSQITESIEEKLKSFTEEEKLWTKINMSKKGDIACGTICSPKIGLGIHWTYSYNKTLRFGLSLVAYGKSTQMIFTTEDVKIHSIKKSSEHSIEDLNTAIEEIFAELKDGISKTKLTDFRKKLASKEITFKQAYVFAAELYFDTKFLSPTQLSFYQSALEEIRNDENLNLWNNYTCMVKALEDCNPKNWLKDNRELSTHFINEFSKTPLVEATEALLVASNNYLKVVENKEEKNNNEIPLGLEPESLSGPTSKETEKSIVLTIPSSQDLSKRATIIPPKKEKTVNEVVTENSTIEQTNFEEEITDEFEEVSPEIKNEPVEEYQSELLKEVIEESEKTVTEEPAPVKKGLGLFSKLTEKVVSENTGKTKNVIIPTAMNEEQIENVLEERDAKFNKNSVISDELTDNETVEELNFETVDEDENLIDDLDIPEAEDFEGIQEVQIEDVLIESATQENEEDVDDFCLNEDKEVSNSEQETEEDFDLLNYGKGNAPSETIRTGSITSHKFEEINRIVVIQN